jgi:hypothetical protein
LHERPGGDHADDEVTNRAGERYGDGDEGSDRPRQLKPRLEGGEGAPLVGPRGVVLDDALE